MPGNHATLEESVSAARRVCAEGLPVHRRAEILDRSADLLEARARELAQLICEEVAKPITLATAEVERTAGTFRFAAAAARTIAGRVVPLEAAPTGRGKTAFTKLVPRGPLAAITPFNFPLNLAAHKIAPAIAAGCPVVLKPAPQAVGTTCALGAVLSDAGLPPGWLNVFAGGPDLGAAIAAHPGLPTVSFTGSERVGWEIASASPRKKVLLELGGSAPAIVAADADLDLAAERLAPNAFSYAGQSCVSVQRIYVEQAVAEEFTTRFLARVADVKAGPADDPSVTCGPMIDDAAVERVSEWIGEARNRGARVLAGGEANGRMLAPTVLENVPDDARLIQEEAFAPVVSLRPVSSLAQGIELANGTRFGLQAAIFTGSLAKAMSAVDALRFGGVLVNEAPTFRADHAPYGGLGDSGNTREGPAYAIRELSEERLVIFDPGVRGEKP